MRYLYLFFIALLNATFVFAGGVKLYVGSSVNSTHYSNHYFMELILCNNTRDTVFVKREDLDNLYPQVTNDASSITDGGSRFLVTNTDEMVEPDPAGMFRIDADGTDSDREEMVKKKMEGTKENDGLRQTEIDGFKYYVILPQKCITVNSYSQIGKQETSRLVGIKEENREKLKVYFTVPVWIISSKDHIQLRDLLISRDSKAVKECLFNTKK